MSRVMRNIVGGVLRFGFLNLASEQPRQSAKPAATGAADVVQHDADNICSNRLQPVSRVFGQLAVGLVRPQNQHGRVRRRRHDSRVIDASHRWGIYNDMVILFGQSVQNFRERFAVQ